ncbi:MAG TPA: ECF transporter S component [Bacillota bacterium]|nr:ECF transporter S component [Bacillota bacterium]
MDIKKISLLALFIALSVIGSFIKIPAVVGSIALDAFPALLAVVLIGTTAGAVVAGMGHMVSAYIGGMTLGPLHIIVAMGMALIVWVFGVIYKSDRRMLAGVIFVLCNSFMIPLPFAFIMSMPFYVALIPSLLVGASVNTVIALILIPRVETIFQKQLAGVIK